MTRQQIYYHMASQEMMRVLYDDLSDTQAEVVLAKLKGPIINPYAKESHIRYTWSYVLKSRDTALLHIEVNKNPFSMTFIDPKVKSNDRWIYLMGSPTKEIGIK